MEEEYVSNDPEGHNIRYFPRPVMKPLFPYATRIINGKKYQQPCRLYNPHGIVRTRFGHNRLGLVMGVVKENDDQLPFIMPY